MTVRGAAAEMTVAVTPIVPTESGRSEETLGTGEVGLSDTAVMATSKA